MSFIRQMFSALRTRIVRPIRSHKQPQCRRSGCFRLSDRVRDILGSLATTRYENAVYRGIHGTQLGVCLLEKAIGGALEIQQFRYPRCVSPRDNRRRQDDQVSLDLNRLPQHRILGQYD